MASKPQTTHTPKLLAKCEPDSPTGSFAPLNMDSKQTASAEPNKRVIKKTKLDLNKMRAFGLESNLLSAIAKFNTATTPKPTPTVNTHNEASIQIASPVKQIAGKRIDEKSPDTPSAKKIHVLSDVLLSDNKLLDLKDFTAIASSTPINTPLAYVSQVPRPSQIKSVQAFQPNAAVVIHTPKADRKRAEIKSVNKPLVGNKHPGKAPNKSAHKSPTKATNNLSNNSSTKSSVKSTVADETVADETVAKKIKLESSDSLSGFSADDVECSRTHFDHLNNEIKTRRATIESENETDGSAEKETSQPSSNLSNTFSPSETISSEDESSESDLEELIKEAQRTIENEQITNEDERNIAGRTARKAKLIKKDLLHSLTEHIDKDRLIDAFLDSTINSFRRQCESPSSDSSDSVDNDEPTTSDIKVDSPLAPSQQTEQGKLIRFVPCSL